MALRCTWAVFLVLLATSGFLHASRVEESDDDLDGEYGAGELAVAQAHAADLRNRLTEVETDTGGGPSAEAIVYDLAGSLVADDLYWYQYDAFNRLACVRLKGTLEFDADGRVTGGAPGAWRAHFAYDGLGRLISKQVPWGAHASDVRWCWYYYDGVRRIAEVFRDPLMVGGGIGGGGPPGGGGYSTYTDREYVWGPDYVDECLWQVDKVGDAAFVLQDGNSNVVGLVDDEGGLLRQYAWDPYGQAIAVDSLGIFGHNRLGHQGLFFDRLDANAPNADLTATARGVYYARNRPYGPHIGRWMTSDPNGTGLAVLGSLPIHGFRPSSHVGSFDAVSLYSDGQSLYAYVRSRPTALTDPTGLFGLVQGLMTGLDMASSAMGAMDEAYQGITIVVSLLATLEDYASTQEMDVDWALDWDAPDDWLNPVGGGDWYDDGDDLAYGDFTRGLTRSVRRNLRPGSFSLAVVEKIRPQDILRKPPQRGRAPIGIDGHPIEVHHVHGPEGPFVEVLKTEHTMYPRPARPLTRQERQLFNSARRDYWRRQWDSGRFD